MTTSGNINALVGSGVLNALKSPVIGQSAGDGAQGILGFLNVMLENLQGASDGNIADLSAIVADFMKANPGDTNGLQALLQEHAPNAPADLLQKISAFLQKTTDAQLQKRPGLISDLTSNIANILQQEKPIEIKIAEILEQSSAQDIAQASPDADLDAADIAEALNNLEPGSTAATTDDDHISTTVDGQIMKVLKNRFSLLKQEDGNIEAFRSDIITYLDDQGVDETEIPAYLNALAKDLRADAALFAPAHNTSPSASAPSAQTDALRTPTLAPPPPAKSGATFGEPATGDAEGSSPFRPATDPQDAGRKQETHQQRTQAPQNIPAAQDAPTLPQAAGKSAQSTPAASMHALLSQQESGGESSLNGGFGQNAHSAHNNQAFGADAIIKEAAGQANFANYVSANKHSSAPTLQMIGLQISRNAAAKADTFRMQLSPAELGTLEVRMTFGKDGKMKAHLIADKPETFNLLQKDSAQLERVLQQSGLEIDDSALTFDLRQDNRQAYNEQDGEKFASYGNDTQDDTLPNAVQAQIAIEAAGYITQTGVNIMV